MAPKKNQQRQKSSSSKGKKSESSSTGPKLQISAENENRLRRLLLNSGRSTTSSSSSTPPVDDSSLSKAQKAKKLRSIYEKLSCEGFSDDQIQRSLTVLKDNATFEATLDWLCLNLPGIELPLKFSSGTSLHTNGGSVGIISTAREDWAPPVDSSAENKDELPEVSVKSKERWDDDDLVSCQPSQADWILRYMEQQEEVESETWEAVAADKNSTEQVAEPRSSFDSIVKEYHTARLEAINAKERGDKKGQEKASQVIRKIKLEMSSLGLLEDVLASGYGSFSCHASEDTSYDPGAFKNPDAATVCDVEGRIASGAHELVSEVDGCTESCSLKVDSTEDNLLGVDTTALEEESGDVELGNFFSEDASSSEPLEVVKLHKKERARDLSSWKNLEKLDGIWKKGDPQKIPKAVLHQLCQKSGWEAPKYDKVLGKGNSFNYTVSVLRKASGRGKNRKAGGLITLQLPSQDGTSKTAEDAQNRVAAFALYRLFPDLPFHFLITEPYGSLVQQWEEGDPSSKVEDDEEDRRAGFVDSLLNGDMSESITSVNIMNRPLQEKFQELHINADTILTAVGADLKAECFNRDREAESLYLRHKQESSYLRHKQESARKMKKYKDILESRASLPIAELKGDILCLLKESNVLVVCGETGCGKTTQVPQFILDDMIEAGHGGHCSIICTQPRRIAMSSSTNETLRKDPAWKYSVLVDPQNMSKFRCNFCQKEMNGGVCRVKQHLVGGYRNVTVCKRCPSAVRDEILEYMNKKKQVKEQVNILPDFDDVVELDGDEYEEDEDVIVGMNKKGKKQSVNCSTRGSNSIDSIPSKLKKPRQIGPIDCYFTPNPDDVNRKGKEKQTRIDDNAPYKKELMERAYVRITRWIYDSGIPFNVVNNESFGPMIEAIGQYGPGLKPPSYHQVRVPYLKKEVDHTNKLMKDHINDRVKYGCSIMCDGWTDKRNRSLLNFLVNCPKGTMFVESIDASSYAKDANKMFQLLDNFVEKIGEDNVVQVVTDSAAANVLAGKFLEASRPNLYWTPCAAHCLDLMLEDIFKLPNLKKAFERAISIHGYIYNRLGLLNMMRRFTNFKELVKPAKTRFATAFLTLQRLYSKRNELRTMFTSDEWKNSKWAKEPQGKKTAQILLMPSFWNTVHIALKFACPLVHVLRLVDGEKKPPMGYIYEAMDRAKEVIANSFDENEDKYKDVFEIIDRRWNVQLHRPLHAAGFYLNPEFYYKNPEAAKDKEISTGLFQCISKLVKNVEVQDRICEELTRYEKAEGLFGIPMAVRQRTTRVPAEWWGQYGRETPNLQTFAIRVLSLTCSASGCERNWSVFEHAISVAERVAHERCESSPGSNDSLVGYQVRLDSARNERTKLLFCTTGILLRKIVGDKNLGGVTHVIVDEVHERSLLGDFLLIVLKNLIEKQSAQTTPKLKVILMSATVDSHLFSQYFGHCPVITAQGRTYPVSTNFLEDIYEKINYRLASDSPASIKYQTFAPGKRAPVNNHRGKKNLVLSAWGDESLLSEDCINPYYIPNNYPMYSEQTRQNLKNLNEDNIDYDLLEDLVCHIDGTYPEGAILVFLPGVAEIHMLLDKLAASYRFSGQSSEWLLPLHSSIASADQKRVFLQPPDNVRKVIIATNIAETSITIDDVVYVVDCGKHKENRYNPKKKLSSMVEDWISQANARQRRGRAGRVKPGICFCLYTRHRFEKIMSPFQIPEMLRMPLVELCLQIKLLSLGNIKPFLSQAVEPPREETVTSAISLLYEVGAIEGDEKLTPLGYHLAKLPVDVLIGKMMIYGGIFGCLSPILSISAFLSYKSPFIYPKDERQNVERAKLALLTDKLSGATDSDETNRQSDHLVMMVAYKKWEKMLHENGVKAAQQFCSSYFLSSSVMYMIRDMRIQFGTLLADIGLINLPTDHQIEGKKKQNLDTWFSNTSQPFNMYSNHSSIVKAILCAGLYPNVAATEEGIAGTALGSLKQKAGFTMKGRSVWYDGKREVHIHPSSINSGLKAFQYPFLIFLEKVETNKVFLRDTTIVSAYSILLFGGSINIQHQTGLVTIDGWLKIAAPAQTAVLFKELRLTLHSILEELIRRPQTATVIDNEVLRSIIHLLLEEDNPTTK